MVSVAMKEMADRGIKTATFGAGAREQLDAVAHVGKLRSKLLSSTYSAIAKTFKLTNKTGYRRKFGAGDASLYVLYPKTISPMGIEAIMASVVRLYLSSLPALAHLLIAFLLALAQKGDDSKTPPETPSAKHVRCLSFSLHPRRPVLTFTLSP